MSEDEVKRQIARLLGSRGHSRLWRNNVGVARAYVKYGLCPGASDLIGYESITVTPQMVGRKLAVFTALEVKGPKGKVSPEHGR